MPHEGDPFAEAVYAGAHRLNGNGELTGLEWIREAGLLSGPIGITNTHSVGVVRDAIVAAASRSSARAEAAWSLPVVGETWDGWLNDIDGQHVRAEHLDAALDGARGGAVAEGNVGGGTGMICHRLQGRHRDSIASADRCRRRLHGRGAGAGQLRSARAARYRRRAGRS